MGLSNESQGGGNWLSVYKGEIVKRVPAGTENAVERTTKHGKVVYELKYNALEGMLKKIVTSESEYGKQWIFVIDDGINEFNLAVPYSSGPANGFLFRLPTVDLSMLIKVKTYYIQGDDDKWRQFLSLEQAGQKIAPYFTKEEKHGLPDLIEVMISGQKRLDDTDRLEFLQRMVDEKINPKLATLHPIDHVEAEEEDTQPAPEEVDDLPF
jgi:hypothetical protein